MRVENLKKIVLRALLKSQSSESFQVEYESKVVEDVNISVEHFLIPKPNLVSILSSNLSMRCSELIDRMCKQKYLFSYNVPVLDITGKEIKITMISMQYHSYSSHRNDFYILPVKLKVNSGICNSINNDLNKIHSRLRITPISSPNSKRPLNLRTFKSPLKKSPAEVTMNQIATNINPVPVTSRKRSFSPTGSTLTQKTFLQSPTKRLSKFASVKESPEIKQLRLQIKSMENLVRKTQLVISMFEKRENITLETLILKWRHITTSALYRLISHIGPVLIEPTTSSDYHSNSPVHKNSFEIGSQFFLDPPVLWDIDGVEGFTGEVISQTEIEFENLVAQTLQTSKTEEVDCQDEISLKEVRELTYLELATKLGINPLILCED
ncbi:hypothetical protein HK096_002990 [Nowakowskiella sp. JEL0078]|nr:hypothetical protein HK096_002990 [Nowakowskiella sp. JEL0078]